MPAIGRTEGEAWGVLRVIHKQLGRKLVLYVGPTTVWVGPVVLLLFLSILMVNIGI